MNPSPEGGPVKSISNPIRAHVASSLMALVYVLLLHGSMWGITALLYTSAYSTAYIVLPIVILIIGLIAFFILRPMVPEKITFYGMLLLWQILFTVLAVASPLTDWLTALAGKDALADMAPDHPAAVYPLFVWLLIGPLMSVLFFLLSVIFTVRDALREMMGHVKRPKKQPKESPEK